MFSETKDTNSIIPNTQTMQCISWQCFCKTKCTYTSLLKQMWTQARWIMLFIKWICLFKIYQLKQFQYLYCLCILNLLFKHRLSTYQYKYTYMQLWHVLNVLQNRRLNCFRNTNKILCPHNWHVQPKLMLCCFCSLQVHCCYIYKPKSLMVTDCYRHHTKCSIYETQLQKFLLPIILVKHRLKVNQNACVINEFK